MNVMNKESDSTFFMTEKYRWIILIVFMFASIMTQVVWITFAPIMTNVAPYYGVTPDAILLITASYLIIYIPVNFPATWLIDKYGLRFGTGIGVFLLGIFGFLRAFTGSDYNLLLFCQVMTAIGQPFVLNSLTKVSVNWFPENEKATATGLGTMSSFIGIILGELLTPFLFEQYGITFVLQFYGVISLLSMILYIVLVKNNPKNLPNKFAGQKAFNYAGMKNLFRNKNFLMLILISFVALGSFNAISSEVEIIFSNIVSPSEAPGILGALMIFGGIIGAGVISTLSDAKRKRVIFMKITMVASTILVGLLIVSNDFTIEALINILFGFFLISGLPVGLVYASEITFPITEEASNGILIMFGQISGIIYIVLFESLDLTTAMLITIVSFVATTLLTFLLKEPEISLKASS